MNKKIMSVILGTIILTSPLASVVKEDTAFAWQVGLPVEENQDEEKVEFKFLPEESTIKNGEKLVPAEAVFMLKFNKAVSTEDLIDKNRPKIWIYDAEGNLADYNMTSIPKSNQDEVKDESLYSNYLSINFNDYKPDTEYRIMMMPGIVTADGEKIAGNHEIRFTSYTLTPEVPEVPEVPETPETPEVPETPGETTNKIEVNSNAAYFKGYDNGLIKPNGAITRAEVARVMQSVVKSAPNVEDPTVVTDVEEGKWYTESINFVLAKGLLRGDKEGTFRPQDEMSREEFVTAIRALTEVKSGKNPFDDVDEKDWSYDYIISAYQNGIIQGYETGQGESKKVSFKPKNSISRAEVATIMNKVIGKKVDLEANKDQIKVYEDLNADHWGYEHMITATITSK